MDIRLQRFHSSEFDTLGLLTIDGRFLCFTLEDEPRKTKVAGETRIPAGTYDLGLRYSPKFTPRYGHDMLHVQNVPGFEYILIHPGNTERDTEGCILVGNDAHFNPHGPSEITRSKDAYYRIYALIAPRAREGSVRLTIT